MYDRSKQLGRELDRILVLDIEATCWPPGETPLDEQVDIIELGWCTIDLQTKSITNPSNILVKPQRSKVSDYCTNLTGLTQQEVSKGTFFPEALRFIHKRNPLKKIAWASYGDSDREQMIKQCKDFDIPYPFSNSHMNISTLFSMMNGINREISLHKALDQIGIKSYGDAHRAGSDAFDAAQVLLHLLIRGRP